MDKATIEPQLKAIMDAVPVCEGLIAANIDGKIIVGQTILPDMDHAGIAKAVGVMLKTQIPAAKKGKVIDITVGLEKGFLVALGKDNDVVIGLLGEDGKTQVGLLLRQLKNLMK